MAGDATVSVTWEPSVSAAHQADPTGYEVEAVPTSRGADGNLHKGTVRQACSARTQEVAVGLIAGCAYSVRVRAVGAEGAGHGDWSAASLVALPHLQRAPSESTSSDEPQAAQQRRWKGKGAAMGGEAEAGSSKLARGGRQGEACRCSCGPRQGQRRRVRVSPTPPPPSVASAQDGGCTCGAQAARVVAPTAARAGHPPLALPLAAALRRDDRGGGPPAAAGAGGRSHDLAVNCPLWGARTAPRRHETAAAPRSRARSPPLPHPHLPHPPSPPLTPSPCHGAAPPSRHGFARPASARHHHCLATVSPRPGTREPRGGGKRA